MFKNLELFTQASAMVRHASERHRVIAENIANADTPHYRAKDLKPFDAHYAELAKSNPNAARDLYQPVELENLSMSPNGNNVSIEDQMVRSVESQIQHEAALRVYKKAMDLLRLSFSKNR